MKINNKTTERFHMKINSFTYQPFAMEREVFQPERSLRPILGKMEIQPKPMVLVAEFRSKMDLSYFLAELMKNTENIIDIDDGFLYRCYLSKLSQPVDEYWQGWYRLTISFLAIQEGSRRIEPLEKIENVVIVVGNWETECLYEITPTKEMKEIEVGGYKVKNLIAGKTVFLDGEQKRVYTETVPNKYPDCTLKDNMFPRLQPGQQVIKVSDASAKVILKYTPIFV